MFKPTLSELDDVIGAVPPVRFDDNALEALRSQVARFYSSTLKVHLLGPGSSLIALRESAVKRAEYRHLGSGLSLSCFGKSYYESASQSRDTEFKITLRGITEGVVGVGEADLKKLATLALCFRRKLYSLGALLAGVDAPSYLQGRDFGRIEGCGDDAASLLLPYSSIEPYFEVLDFAVSQQVPVDLLRSAIDKAERSFQRSTCGEGGTRMTLAAAFAARFEVFETSITLAAAFQTARAASPGGFGGGGKRPHDDSRGGKGGAKGGKKRQPDAPPTPPPRAAPNADGGGGDAAAGGDEQPADVRLKKMRGGNPAGAPCTNPRCKKHFNCRMSHADKTE